VNQHPELPAEAAGDNPGEWRYEGGRWMAAPHLHPDGTRRWDGTKWTEWPPKPVQSPEPPPPSEPQEYLASEHIKIQSPFSFVGSARRIWPLSQRDPRWLTIPSAVLLVYVAWMLVAAYYLVIIAISIGFLGIPVIFYRAMRRRQRKAKIEELRHREMLDRLDRR
jgi:hypothetical protein